MAQIGEGVVVQEREPERVEIVFEADDLQRADRARARPALRSN